MKEVLQEIKEAQKQSTKFQNVYGFNLPSSIEFQFSFNFEWGRDKHMFFETNPLDVTFMTPLVVEESRRA